MPRRLPGRIAAMLLMVPLLLRANDRGCRQHDDQHANASKASATQSMEGHAHHHSGSEPTRAPSEHHPLADCCPAMSSCGGAAIQAPTNVLAGWPWHDQTPGYDTALLHSRVESPDPPPPKA